MVNVIKLTTLILLLRIKYNPPSSTGSHRNYLTRARCSKLPITVQN